MPRFLFRCEHCHTFCLFGGKVEQGRAFCSIGCRDIAFGKEPRFCASCETQAGGKDPFTGTRYIAVAIVIFGTVIGGSADPCPACGSYVSTKWFFVFAPILPLGSYRILWRTGHNPMGFRVPLHRPHLAWTYGVTLSVLALIALGVWRFAQ